MKAQRDIVASLKQSIEAIPGLKITLVTSTEFKMWHRATLSNIESAFGNRSMHVSHFRELANDFYPWNLYGVFGWRIITRSWRTLQTEKLDEVAELLTSFVDEIEQYGNAKIKGNNKIFVVHGRDNSSLETLTQFLERSQLQPVVLGNRPNQGLTIIEKFESNADVGFAIVLLTPDDHGGLQNTALLQPRARQNVVFELGYFIAKLGRSQVCVLTMGDVDIPSDYAGVVYIPMDGNWQSALYQELLVAGYIKTNNR